MIVTAAWTALWPFRNGTNVTRVSPGHCGHQRPVGPDIRASAGSSGAARPLQKLMASSTAICGRTGPRPCVLVSKLASKVHLLIVSPIGVDASECKICINLVSLYGAVDLGITLS